MQKLFYAIIASLIIFTSCERSGADIYKSAFNKKPEEVEILNSLDAVVPVIDYAVMIHFKAPKDELERIINGYEVKDFSGYPPSGVSGVPQKWISEENFNSCTHYEKHSSDGRFTEKLYIDCKNGEALYVNYY